MKHITPAFFLGHGSPLSALEKNLFTQEWEKIGKSIQKPKVILAISAHFETYGTQIQTDIIQKTIHDFSGFPDELYQVNYQVKGDEALADEIIRDIPEIKKTTNFGLDHGVWSILVHMFPEKNIPVLSLSLDVRKNPQEHFELGKKLQFLREKGVLIIGSGNIVHNLKLLHWEEKNSAYAWALEYNQMIKNYLLKNDTSALLNFMNLPNSNIAIAGKEHFLPLIYIFATKFPGESLSFFNDILQMGSISMTSFQLGE